MSYLGDIVVGQVLYFHFTTRQFSTGAPITSASLALSVYKDDSTTQSTSGITTTFTTGFDGVAGLVSVKVDTSSDGTFYAAGHDFSVVVTTGTADSVSIVGEVVGYFSIQNRSALRPTTAGRTLVVDASGLADANMVKVGPTGSGTAQTAKDLGAINVTNLNTLSGHDPGATLASQTNITGGTITTVTTLTNAPSDSSGVTTLLTRIGGTITISGGIVSADVKKVNAVTVNGDGSATPWGP